MVRANYEANLLLDGGIAWKNEDTTLFQISGLGLSTFGFIYALTDVWVDAENCTTVTYTAAENCETVTWAPCECAEICE